MVVSEVIEVSTDSKVDVGASEFVTEAEVDAAAARAEVVDSLKPVVSMMRTE